jgi:hypothetical protein
VENGLIHIFQNQRVVRRSEIHEAGSACP